MNYKDIIRLLPLVFILFVLVFFCNCVTSKQMCGSADGPTSVPTTQKIHRYTDTEMIVIWKKLSRCNKWSAKCKNKVALAKKLGVVECNRQKKHLTVAKESVERQLVTCQKLSKKERDSSNDPKKNIHWTLIAVPAYVGGL